MTAAPTEPAALATPAVQSTWPIVIGIIAIVFASLAIFQNGICAPIGLLMTGVFSSMMEDMSGPTQGAMEAQVAQMDAIKAYVPHSLAVSLAMTAAGIVLLVGGVQLVKRRYRSRTTITAWAVLKMVLALPAAYVSYLSSQAQFAAMAKAAADDPGGVGQAPPGFFSLLEGLGVVGAVITLLWYWALPVFMLIWFARRPIQDEVRTWGAAATGASHPQAGRFQP